MSAWFWEKHVRMLVTYWDMTRSFDKIRQRLCFAWSSILAGRHVGKWLEFMWRSNQLHSCKSLVCCVCTKTHWKCAVILFSYMCLKLFGHHWGVSVCKGSRYYCYYLLLICSLVFWFKSSVFKFHCRFAILFARSAYIISFLLLKLYHIYKIWISVLFLERPAFRTIELWLVWPFNGICLFSPLQIPVAILLPSVLLWPPNWIYHSGSYTSQEQFSWHL